MMKPPETNESLTKEKMMDRAVREGLLRIMPPNEKLDYFFFTFSLLAWVCVYLVNQVKSLGAAYGLLQLLRVLAVAHVLRFVQSEIYKVPSKYYLQNVLKFYDLPITATISAFYTVFLIFPSPPNIILFPALFLLLSIILGAPTQRIGLEQDKSPSQGSSSNNELVHQKNPIDIQLTDHFATILMAMMCVDLAAVELEKLKGTYYVFSMVFVLASRHLPYFWQLGELPENNVPLAFHLQKVLQYYELPSTAAINGIYIIFITFSKTLFIVFCMELILLAILIMYKREEPEQGTKPTQASSLNTNSLSVHQHSQDVANIGDGGIPSVHNANSGTNNFSGWEKGERIGAGGFGTVFKAHNREIGEGAVKVLNIGPNNECIRQEAGIISELKHHPNIIKYYGHDIDEKGHICLYMEYIKQGSLHDYVLKHGKLDEPFIRNFTAQILSGLFHLHRNKIVHRDIKPENLLVDYDNTVKLVDFGLAKVLAESKGKHSVWGTLYYAAPELLYKQQYESSSEAYKADIWSLGCVIIYMVTRDHPLTGYDQQHPYIPKRLSKEGKDFLKLCFTRNPANRPSAEELLKDPFVTEQNGALIKKGKHYQKVLVIVTTLIPIPTRIAKTATPITGSRRRPEFLKSVHIQMTRRGSNYEERSLQRKDGGR